MIVIIFEGDQTVTFQANFLRSFSADILNQADI